MPPAALVVVTAVVNPLNVVSATDRVSQDVFFRYIAPLYGREGDGRNRAENGDAGSGRQPITVVMLDDHFVETIGSGWPVSHRTMTRFLQTLYCYAPKSVFFDLLFTHEHSASSQTDQFISYLKGEEKLHDKIVQQCARSATDRERHENADGSFDDGAYQAEVQAKADELRNRILPLPPAHIGDFAPQKNFPVKGGSAVFEKLVEAGVPRLATNWVADDGAYPLVVALDGEAAAGSDEDVVDAAFWRRVWPGHVDGKVPSAALALYATLRADEDLAALVAEEQAQLIVEWGFYPRHLSDEAMRAAEYDQPDRFLSLRQFPDGCHVRPDDFSWPLLQPLAPLKESVWQFMMDTVGVLDPNPGQPRQTCPYNQWIPGEAVFAAVSQEQKATLRRLFEGRVVMIGADIKGAPDLVQSPVHGQIPGVFLHAMALDNLLERGLDGYWRPMPTLPERSYIPAIVSEMSIGTTIEMALLWAIFALSSLVTLWRKKAGERWSETAYNSVELLGHVVLVFGTVAALAAYAIAPMNWLGLVTLAVSKDVLSRFQLPKLEAASIARLQSKFSQ